ncbi:MAG: hypothetical protein F4Y03_11350 [Alphaproteobacteria bacterium]|nr:hypothetical protein [Alphaproteobacteria bacterium]
MLERIVKMVEDELGAAGRAVLPVVLREVEAVLKDAESGAFSLAGLAGKLEQALGDAGRALAARIIAELLEHLAPGPVEGHGGGKLPPHVQGFDPGGIIKKAEQAALSAIHSAESGAVSAVHSAQSTATAAVKSVETEAVAAVKAVWHDVESGLFGQLAKAGIAAAVKVARAVSPGALSVTLGPVTLNLVNIPGAIDLLAAAEQHPPHDRASLKSFVEGLEHGGFIGGVQIQGDVALAALVVESDSLSVGFQAEWDGPTFVSRFDLLMDAIGLD